jgi:conjugative relaxase-like TrwC/TraI family protein
MTVRVTTLKHASAGRYYTEHLPSYYLDSGEPPGRWFGRGATMLGLNGDIDAEAFLAMTAGFDPASGSVLGRRFGESSVRGFDATFSAPKSVSVLFGVGDDEVRRRVTEAHDRAVDAVLGWVESQAHTRLRRRGHVVCVDVEGIVVGVFRQHTSRRLDPQLHTHAVIANRVRSPDGRWLALDARTLKMDQRTLSALYHVTLRTELTRRLGVVWHRPVNGIAEIAGVDRAVLAEFSQRSGDVERRLDEKLARFRGVLGREPNRQEQWRLEREAVVDSRPAKDHTRTSGELHHEWQSRLAALGFEPRPVVAEVVGQVRRSKGIDQEATSTMIDRTLEALTERQSTWRPAELVRELAAQVPTEVAVDPNELCQFLQQLAAHTVVARCVDLSPPMTPGAVIRRDGRPVSEAAIDRLLTTQAILDEEERLLEWAQRQRRLGEMVDTRRLLTVEGLSPGQADACAAVAGVAPLELIVGPAGSGKTTALAPAVYHLQGRGQVVFGVTPTAAAAEVLATEATIAADTLDKLLYEHTRPDRSPEPAYDLPAGATVIVDEAGTVSTPKLAALARLADRRAWRVIMVGDPRQFSAVGRGGMFAHLIDACGAVELDQIHRFAHRWERDASRRLRTRDVSVIAEYERQGRLHDGTQHQMQVDIIDAWREARLRGESVALMANTNDTVARLNQLAQQRRIANGELHPDGPALEGAGQRLLAGDDVVSRRNQRTLRTDRGMMVKNRDQWTIQEIHPDQSVTIAGHTGTVLLPADYVYDHVELGYAQTSHATQGRTVDIGLLMIDGPTDSRGIYTPMTRGRSANYAYVVADENQTAADVLTQAIGRDWIDRPAVTRRTEVGIGDQPRARLRSQLGGRHSESLASPHRQVGSNDLKPPGSNPGLNNDQAWRQVQEHIKTIEQRRRDDDRKLDRTHDAIGR